MKENDKMADDVATSSILLSLYLWFFIWGPPIEAYMHDAAALRACMYMYF